MPKDDKQRSLDVLGLERNASKNDIRLAFFKKSLYSYPDTVKNNSEMASFTEVTQAYSNLSDGSDGATPDEVFFKFFQEVLKDDNAQSLRAMLQEHDATKCADDEYRCEEDDNEIDIEREFERLLEILKNRKKKGKDVPEDMTQDKVVKCRDNLVRQREEAKKDPKKQAPKKGKQQQVPVSKPKPKSKKQLLAEQRRREKEMEKIAVELEMKKKEDEEKEKIRKQMDAEKQKRLEEERKKTEAEARRQRER
ncbi:trinucleotide repeat-containing gene 6A -like [Paramuricea clavata]|uniref:Trinucleotide repeat-containing gene 6A -like n=1 Tax=Paramuricea clavata TaxID=317549 RepID=A0A6S7JI60_PARCT|nr:trinucleotide repeat-containing gene 6A -like [Paramuricea clavata]